MNEKYVAYVGCYTHGDAQGIHIYDMDVKKGRITERGSVEINNSSYIILSNDQHYLYSICDEGVAAFCVLENGDLELMNVESINGMRGCHLAITSDNRFLVVSGYHDGKITVMKLNPDGSIDGIADEVFHKGLGSVSERNFRPHVECCTFTPDEDLLCACDLGIDQIKIYTFNHETGHLKLYDIIRTQLESAPRQMSFSPDGKFAYVVCEMQNYINVYSYKKAGGKYSFEFIQNIFTVRKQHKSNNAANHFVFDTKGEYAACSNAGSNTVTLYRVDKATGNLCTLSNLPISGNYPKFLNIFPDDKHLLCMNTEGNTITIFTLHWPEGLIVMNGPEVKLSSPNNMVIKKL